MGISSSRDRRNPLQVIIERLVAVERRLNNGYQPIMTGSTASRDDRFGTPSTAPDRLALANRAPIWYNSDLGYWEGYFIPEQVGLKPRGLAVGEAPGWYPLVSVTEVGPPFAP